MTLKCPTCGNDGVIHHGGHCANYSRCALCGQADSPDSYMKSSEAVPIMRELNVCFVCAFWELRVRAGAPTVIDGHVYTPGPRTSGHFLGMAGRRFDIEYLESSKWPGRRITTFDLWSSGKIPGAFRERLPDTARFLHGASKSEVGDTTCWSPSDRKSEQFPLPTMEIYES